jgi:hypothetical protein
MAFSGGVRVEEDGPGRWRLVEPGRGPEGVLAALTGDDESGYHMEPAADTASAPPTGAYGTIDAAVEALEAWRNARFEGRRD